MTIDCELVQEIGTLSDSLLSGTILNVSESALLSDAIRNGTVMSVTETGTLSEAVTLAWWVSVVEVGTLSDAAAPRSEVTVLLTETGKLSDALRVTGRLNVSESGVLSDAIVSGVVSLLAESGVLSDTALPRSIVTVNVVEVGTLSDSVREAILQLVAETGTLSDSALPRSITRLALSEVGTLSDAITGKSVAVVLVVETGQLDSGAVPRADARLNVVEVGVLSDAALPPLLGYAWAMSTESLAPSRYESFPFTSMAMVDGRPVGLSDDGLYLLEGANDEGSPINASITSGLMGADDHKMSRLPYVYITYTADGPLQLKVSSTMTGAEVGHVYPLQERVAGAPVPTRTQPGRGIRALLWRLELSNVNGANFELVSTRPVFAPVRRSV